jgi:hypothetical protein
MIHSLVSENKITLLVTAELAKDNDFILRCSGDAQKN